MAAAAIGTETSGSIISPASQNSVVGIKPTHGLISRQGIIPITHSQDTAGPITRSVADAAIILGVLTGVDSRDEVTLKSEGQFCKDYTPFLDSHALKHTRIGIPRYYYKDLDPDRLSVIEAAIQVVKDQGATVIDPVEIGTEQIAWNWHVLLYEFKKGVNDYLGKLPDHIPVHSLQEVIAFNIEHSESCLKYGQDVLVQAEKTSGTLTEPAYLDSLRMNHELARDQGLEAVMKLHQLDALMFLGDEDVNDLASRAGFPVVTVPGGYALDGVIASGGYNTKGPQGISFAGIAFSEPTLIKIAYSYEQATKHRLPPIME
ncbi:aspartyl-tRNA(Asn) amidotransferase [Paenibacillus pini JCM 16418]|uniref:Aspartyl-tRNA(Asn) amidotransferase n=1 Tax=Paenibacillus pini JCM 16418 TaxID=1236976 RepID=W7YP88_9BACL|nr:aspartyl-tRNA(Asn) amidotransferase [Paenibacillus pini JCM 16418]